MTRQKFHLGLALMWLSAAVTGSAQQGHPLTGTWNGDWGVNPTQRTPITVVMTWDGKEVKGVLNPGPDSSATVVSVAFPKGVAYILRAAFGAAVTAQVRVQRRFRT